MPNGRDELIEGFVGKIFDSNPIQFRKRHKTVKRSMQQYLESGRESPHSLPTPILRNSFLYNCHLLTKDEPLEHLIVGYGIIRGGGADIYEVQHIKGEWDHVDIPIFVENQMRLWFLEWESPEIDIYHSHPTDVVDELTALEPWPSTPDREYLLGQRYLNLDVWFDRLMGGTGRYKLFLGSAGKVVEIRTPPIMTILRILQSIGLSQTESLQTWRK